MRGHSDIKKFFSDILSNAKFEKNEERAESLFKYFFCPIKMKG